MGSQTIVVPIIGNTPARQAKRVKSKALGTPNIKKAIPTSKPCKIPKITCP